MTKETKYLLIAAGVGVGGLVAYRMGLFYYVASIVAPLRNLLPHPNAPKVVAPVRPS